MGLPVSHTSFWALWSQSHQKSIPFSLFNIVRSVLPTTSTASRSYHHNQQSHRIQDGLSSCFVPQTDHQPLTRSIHCLPCAIRHSARWLASFIDFILSDRALCAANFHHITTRIYPARLRFGARAFRFVSSGCRRSFVVKAAISSWRSEQRPPPAPPVLLSRR